MLTIFAIPKAFSGPIRIIQRNAIRSWKALGPDCEVILLGSDDGVAETASELGLRHYGEIATNAYGTPMMDSAFDYAQRHASHDTLMYANADVMFLEDLLTSIRRIPFPSYLMSGRRWDLDMTEDVDFGDSRWRERLRAKVAASASLHGPSGKDYFIFRRGDVRMLPFAVGRAGWDDWLVYDCRVRRMPVINATLAITAVHQNHDYSHSAFAGTEQVEGPERTNNVLIAGGPANLMSLQDANWVLERHALKRPPLLLRLRATLAEYALWRALVGELRRLRHNYLRVPRK